MSNLFVVLFFSQPFFAFFLPTKLVRVGGMAWAAQLHAVMQHHAWAAAVQTPGGAAGQFAAHQVLLVALRAHQAGATGGGAAVASVPAAGSSAKEASSFGPAVDQGHKSLAEISRWVAVWHIAWTNSLSSSLSTRSLLISCAS